MKMRKKIILFKSNKGVTFEKINMKKISKVIVMNKKEFCRAYKFNNTHGVQFDSPHISWENLNCCGKWIYDKDYLKSAVQIGKKICAGVDFNTFNEVNSFVEEIDRDKYVYIIKKQHKPYGLSYRVDIALKGKLSDYYELKQINNFYELLELDINLEDEDRFMELFSANIIDLINGNKNLDYESKSKTIAEDIITGLLLGYPLESTIAYIGSRQARKVYN